MIRRYRQAGAILLLVIPSACAAPGPAPWWHTWPLNVRGLGEAPILTVTRGGWGGYAGEVQVFNRYGDNRITYRVNAETGAVSRDQCPSVESLFRQMEQGRVLRLQIDPRIPAGGFLDGETVSISALSDNGAEVTISSHNAAGLHDWVNALFSTVRACLVRTGAVSQEMPPPQYAGTPLRDLLASLPSIQAGTPDGPAPVTPSGNTSGSAPPGPR